MSETRKGKRMLDENTPKRGHMKILKTQLNEDTHKKCRVEVLEMQLEHVKGDLGDQRELASCQASKYQADIDFYIEVLKETEDTVVQFQELLSGLKGMKKITCLHRMKNVAAFNSHMNPSYLNNHEEAICTEQQIFEKAEDAEDYSKRVECECETLKKRYNGIQK